MERFLKGDKVVNIDLENLKPQWLMTKQDLVSENRELRIYIDQLERQLQQGVDVFQNGNLDTIINETQEECRQADVIVLHKSASQLQKEFDDMLSQYKKYREVTAEKPVRKEININVNSLKAMLNVKP